MIIDDNEDILFALKLLLRQHVELIETINGPERIPELMNKEDWDVILLDMNFSKGQNTGNEGFYWLNRILKTDSDAIVILITAYGDVEIAVRAIQNGATDFILKPFDNDKLLATINSAIKLRHSKIQIKNLLKTFQF